MLGNRKSNLNNAVNRIYEDVEPISIRNVPTVEKGVGHKGTDCWNTALLKGSTQRSLREEHSALLMGLCTFMIPPKPCKTPYFN